MILNMLALQKRLLKNSHSQRRKVLLLLASHLLFFSTSHALNLKGRVNFPEGYPLGDVAVVYLTQPEVAAKKLQKKTWIIDQKNYQFAPSLVVAALGDELVFKNSDPDLHTMVVHSGPLQGSNVTLLKGKKKSLAIQALGHSEILCSIHSQMKANLLVLNNRHFVITKHDGTFTIDLAQLKPPFEVHVWHNLLSAKPKIVSNEQSLGAKLTFELQTEK